MRTTKLFTILVLALVGFANGQESKKYLKFKDNYNYREGYIITKDSSKIEGLIKDNLMMNELKKYTIVNFVYPDGRKTKYYPSGLKGFGYSIYKFVSDNSGFYKVVQTGKKVGLYKNLSFTSWSTPGSPGMAPMTYSSSSEDFYVKRTNETSFKLVSKKKFKEDFSQYFEDCDEVVSGVLEGKLTHKDIKTIVRKYNYCK